MPSAGGSAVIGVAQNESHQAIKRRIDNTSSISVESRLLREAYLKLEHRINRLLLRDWFTIVTCSNVNVLLIGRARHDGKLSASWQAAVSPAGVRGRSSIVAESPMFQFR